MRRAAAAVYAPLCAVVRCTALGHHGVVLARAFRAAPACEAAAPDALRAAEPPQLATPQPPPLVLQQTLRRSFSFAGVGLHSGQAGAWAKQHAQADTRTRVLTYLLHLAPEELRVRPAFAGEGRYFVLLPPRAPGEAPAAEAPPGAEESAAEGSPGERRVPASAAALPPAGAAPTPLRTVLRAPGGGAEAARVSTPEHLLAALEAWGVDNARCELRGSGEVPVLDGSALPFVTAVARAGLATARCAAEGAPMLRRRLALRRALAVRDGAAFVTFSPGPAPRLAAGVHFPDEAAVLGLQWVRWGPGTGDAFARDVAPARTFATAAGVRAAQAAGLAKGGSLDCALVAENGAWLNPPTEAHGALRLPNEPAAHKLLDLLGDVALAARPGHAGMPLGTVTAFRAGHALHARFVAALTAAAAEEGDDAWVTEIAPRGQDAAREARRVL